MNLTVKNICCIGAGYVGGPTMAVIASNCPSIQINLVDINKNRIKAWNEKNLNKLPIYEPGLSDLILKTRGVNLHFSTEIEKCIANADMIFISVNTPTKTKGIGAGKAVDLRWIESCARKIGEYSKGLTIVVEKSTLPVKTAQTIKDILKAYEDNNSKRHFSILSNPEFLAEGTAIKDLECPDRVLIGGDEEYAMEALENIYLNWVEKEKILKTDIWSSELSKLIANAFLAQRISSINSISALCELTESNISDVSLAVGMDKRIGAEFLNAGPGFGGSCFKKDILNLIYICNHYGLTEVADYWEQVILINDWQKKRITKKIIEKLFGTLSNKRIAVLGFSFKANTNDTRESPAIDICKDFLEEGCNLSIYDPKVEKEQIFKDLIINSENYSKLETTDTIEKACLNSDAIIVMTDWQEFYKLDFLKLSKIMRKPRFIFDTRNVINLKEAKNFGFRIWNLGDGSFQ